MATMQLGKDGFTIWVTGMSGSGKSTLAAQLGQRMRSVGRLVEVLDADDLQKHNLSVGLDASKDDRNADVRRLGYVARLLSRNGVVAIVASTSPLRESRDQNRKEIGRFVEVFADAPVETLIARDPRGFYKKALAGELQNVIGITAPYEPPTNPEVAVKTHAEKVDASVQQILQTMLDLGYLRPGEVSVMIGQKARRRPVDRKRHSRPARATRTVPKRTQIKPVRKAHRPAKSSARRAKR
jgi:adenylylsulfate kinase